MAILFAMFIWKMFTETVIGQDCWEESFGSHIQFNI